ncbi:serine hydrolase [bacterium]|nr:serine hydrolase [bacterium]
MGRKHLRMLLLPLLAALILGATLCLPAATGAAAGPAAGYYLGAIELPGRTIETRLVLSRSNGGEWTAAFDFPGLQISGLPTEEITIDDGGQVYISLRFAEEDLLVEFSGSYDAAANTITGNYFQSGMSFPFSLAFGDPHAAARAAATRLADLRKLVPEWLPACRTPGAAVGVVMDGEVIFSEGFGLRDIENELPVTPQTRFHIASVTKTFTATLLAQLVDDGLLDWDRPIIEYIPDFALYDETATEHCTLRDLACHRTGLPRHDLVWLGHAGFDRDELFAALRYLEPNADFRNQWQYCNLTFAAAGVVAEHVTGERWEDLVQARLLDPLGMTATTTSVAAMEQATDFARGYGNTGPALDDYSNYTPVGHFAADCVPASGSLQSSLEDMLKYLDFQLTGMAGGERIISAEQLTEIHLPQMAIGALTMASQETPVLNGGLAWAVGPYRGYYSVFHGGIMDGCTAEVMLIPELKAGIVVLTNGQFSALPKALTHEIADRLLELEPSQSVDRIIAVLDQMGGGEMGGTPVIGAQPETASPLPLASYAGVYAHPAYGTISIIAREDGLAGTYNGFAYVLTHLKDHEFIMAHDPADESPYPPLAGNLPLTFMLADDGTVHAVSSLLEPAVNPIEFARGA